MNNSEDFIRRVREHLVVKHGEFDTLTRQQRSMAVQISNTENFAHRVDMRASREEVSRRIGRVHNEILGLDSVIEAENQKPQEDAA